LLPSILLGTGIVTVPAPPTVAETVKLNPTLPPVSGTNPEQKNPSQTPGVDTTSRSGAGEATQVIFSTWTKTCVKAESQNDIQVCYIGEDAHTPSGKPVVAAVLIEPANDTRKILRVTLPLGMRLASGTRVEIDQGQPLNAPYLTCIDYGCVADYEASGDLIDELKRGKEITIQCISLQNQVFRLALSLANFEKVYDGPPSGAALSAQDTKEPSAGTKAEVKTLPTPSVSRPKTRQR